MPTKQAEEFIEQSVQEVSTKVDARPLRVRVIYLGAARNKSVCLKGSILTEHFEDKTGTVLRRVLKDEKADPRIPENWEERPFVQIRKVVDGGLSSYDFSTHDAKGLLIKDAPDAPVEGRRTVPARAPFAERFWGKRCEWVEHPTHIAEFHLGIKDHARKRQPGEFEVVANPADMPLIQEVIRRVRRKEGRRAADLAEYQT